jgi:hypothetical protein
MMILPPNQGQITQMHGGNVHLLSLIEIALAIEIGRLIQIMLRTKRDKNKNIAENTKI